MNAPASHAAHKPTVDAYSFGQVLFFSVCGRDPAILDESGNQRAFSEKLGTLSISERTAHLLSSLYQECTARSPEKRLSDFRTICDRLSQALTLCRTTDTKLSSLEFLKELRFHVTGEISHGKDADLHGSVSLKSRSGRTEVSLLIKQENADSLAFEAVFMPSQSPVIGGNTDPAVARKIVNSRIDSVLNGFSANNPKRSAPKSGAYQSVVAFDGIKKDADGLSRCRDLLMNIVDCIERG